MTMEQLDMKTRAEWLAETQHPGKFQGCAAYVPYFWEQFLDGCADRDDGEVLGFNVTAIDKKLFPELARRRTVNLYETSAGFVCEVRS